MTRKGDPNPKICPSAFKMVAPRANVLQGQPLHPLSHARQSFTDPLRKDWGTHLGDLTTRGTCS